MLMENQEKKDYTKLKMKVEIAKIKNIPFVGMFFVLGILVVHLLWISRWISFAKLRQWRTFLAREQSCWFSCLVVLLSNVTLYIVF